MTTEERKGEITLDEQIASIPTDQIEALLADEKKLDEAAAKERREKEKAIKETRGRAPSAGRQRRKSEAPKPIPSIKRYKHSVVKGKAIKQSDFEGDEDVKIDRSDREDMYFHNPKAKGPRVLLVDGKLKRISEIDTAAETFRCGMHYYLTWLATEEEVEGFYKNKLKKYNPKMKFYKPAFFPKLNLLNAVDGDHDLNEKSGIKLKPGSAFKNVTKLEIANSWPIEDRVPKVSWDMPKEAIGFDPRKGYWLRVQYEIDCICAEELELEFFPFDCQDFGCHFSCTEKIGRMELLPFPRAGCFFSVDARFSMVGEWYIPGVVIEFSHGGTSKVGQPYAGMSLRIKAERKWQSHMANMLITFCMYFLGLGMFAIAPEEIGDRLGYAMTLVLADVATLQLMFDSMPAIPYETFMDMYTYSCFLFLVVQTIYSCYAGFHGEKRGIGKKDFVVLMGFLVAFVIVHLAFFVYFRIRRNTERTKLWMTGQEISSFYSHEESVSVTIIPNCECHWDSDTMLKHYSNEIFSKDFPLQDTADKQEMEEFELEQMSRQISNSRGARPGA